MANVLIACPVVCCCIDVVSGLGCWIVCFAWGVLRELIACFYISGFNMLVTSFAAASPAGAALAATQGVLLMFCSPLKWLEQCGGFCCGGDSCRLVIPC
jgi:hypothetical protein